MCKCLWETTTYVLPAIRNKQLQQMRPGHQPVEFNFVPAPLLQHRRGFVAGGAAVTCLKVDSNNKKSIGICKCHGARHRKQCDLCFFWQICYTRARVNFSERGIEHQPECSTTSLPQTIKTTASATIMQRLQRRRRRSAATNPRLSPRFLLPLSASCYAW